MTLVQALMLIIAFSLSFNIALVVGILSNRSGSSIANATLCAGGSAGSCLMIYFAAIAAYR
ncbi:hypothetical protein ACIRL2_41590 [Embleya sp. NPDC127516]|uniref:hypothetical protein n=1 Tax=Embleya sp. NPDC127516 TaxID=3363990 RepID=UPI0037F5F253